VWGDVMIQVLTIFTLYLLASNRLTVYKNLVTNKNGSGATPSNTLGGQTSYVLEEGGQRMDMKTALDYGGVPASDYMIHTGLTLYDAVSKIGGGGGQ
jgi:hypothetical protein